MPCRHLTAWGLFPVLSASPPTAKRLSQHDYPQPGNSLFAVGGDAEALGRRREAYGVCASHEGREAAHCHRHIRRVRVTRGPRSGPLSPSHPPSRRTCSHHARPRAAKMAGGKGFQWTEDGVTQQPAHTQTARPIAPRHFRRGGPRPAPKRGDRCRGRERLAAAWGA